MTHITHDELKHIAKLSALTITKEDEDRLLPQLENIVTFVEKLNECDVSSIENSISDHTMNCNEGCIESIKKDDFLANVSHSTESGMILIDVSTNE